MLQRPKNSDDPPTQLRVCHRDRAKQSEKCHFG
jgi:hypothetical protein